METIKFSYNWNKKLGCLAFTTWRLHNERKYVVGKMYQIECKGVETFTAECVDIKHLMLSQVNEFIARVDTGYSVGEFKNIIYRIYKDKADTGVFDFILLIRRKT